MCGPGQGGGLPLDPLSLLELGHLRPVAGDGVPGNIVVAMAVLGPVGPVGPH